MPIKEQIPVWKELGFESEYEYLSHLAKEEGFKSLEHKYQELYAQQKGFKSEKERRLSLVERAGFSSETEYQDYLARQRGFKNKSEYQKYRMKMRGFNTPYEYYDYLAKKKGFGSWAEFQRGKYQQRAVRRKGFESKEERQMRMQQIEKSVKENIESLEKQTVCQFLQEKIDKNVDPESLFAKSNIGSLRRITGCNIKLNKRKEKQY